MRLDFLKAMKEMDRQIIDLQDKYQKDLAELTAAREVLGLINETCPFCGGAGFRLRPRACAEDDRPDPNDPRDRISCKSCHGTGWKHWTDEKGVEHSAENYKQFPRLSRVSEQLRSV